MLPMFISPLLWLLQSSISFTADKTIRKHRVNVTWNAKVKPLMVLPNRLCDSEDPLRTADYYLDFTS